MVSPNINHPYLYLLHNIVKIKEINEHTFYITFKMFHFSHVCKYILSNFHLCTYNFRLPDRNWNKSKRRTNWSRTNSDMLGYRGQSSSHIRVDQLTNRCSNLWFIISTVGDRQLLVPMCSDVTGL